MLLTSSLIPGNWYISVVCACRKRLILFRDLTQGKGNLQGVYVVTCPACGAKDTYIAEHYRHQPNQEVRPPIWVLDHSDTIQSEPGDTASQQ